MEINNHSDVFKLLSESDSANYIGENVSQLEHSLQSAVYMEQNGESDELILAAMLHDIGHLLPSKHKMGPWGVQGHEIIGHNLLKKIGFSQKVCALVKGHVNAKRYLISTSKAYRKKLSTASLATLEYQGGFMSSNECKIFEQSQWCEDKIKTRYADDWAKQVNYKTPKISYYKNLFEKH